MNSVEQLRQIWSKVLAVPASEIEDDDSFFDLGGDSVKAIQLLSEAAQSAITVDLQTFYDNSTVKDFWSIISPQVQGRNGWGPVNRSCDKSTGRTDDWVGRKKTDINLETVERALKEFNIERESVCQIAPISPIQGELQQSGNDVPQSFMFRLKVALIRFILIEFFLHLGLNGNVGLINYVYEVEGRDLKQGLAQLTKHLEAKNPIFRTIIIEDDTGKFTQVRLSYGLSTWTYPTDLQTYLNDTMTEKQRLGASSVRYSLVLGDERHQGKSFFVISFDHTHCDAFSRYLIDKEIRQILEQPAEYSSLQNPERPWYGDFVEHNRAHNHDDRLSQYWASYMKSANLANVHPLNEAVVGGELDGELVEIVPIPVVTQSRRTRGQINPSHVILAAWAMALSKHSGLKDIAFGLARHGRSSDSFMDLSRVMGPLVTGTPFRVKLDDTEKGTERFLNKVKEEVLETAKWEQGVVPNIHPDAEGNPWVQSMVNLKSELYGFGNESWTADKAEANITAIKMRRDLQQYEFKSNWAILLSTLQKQGQLRLRMYYQSQLLDHDKAQAFFANFKFFIAELAKGSEDPITSLLDSDS
ncbi:fumonisin cluster-peptidsynthase condensation domain [Fusarium proliferatum ET1]|uniref:Fumonisin cluster-peptidsynthase condensation domain n=1 Tax=Fusarium proliferatum (strain ET1) TaxID=1227346 RepID=A0A1L7W5M3_FUSPR|nr:fumonisin cluster-peptidsynthase condensation domain [Fusarium proliferatum ET1]CZR47917.1 fumonisin cluster-peptidsynthase condensation domain [Fusarium proliferatum ET1]